VQEGIAKRSELAGQKFEYHLIGPLQKNKVNKAVSCFDWLETIDSLELACKIDQACLGQDRQMPVLIQVNLANEPTKSGIGEEDLFRLGEQVQALRYLSLRGLMTIPPYFPNPDEVRPFFRRLRKLLELWNSQCSPKYAMTELSMGMSHDFPIAIAEGATIVRVGTAIFGERQSL
jgi:pyridoxal phosphate enzyme (YggS family)